MPVTNGVPVGRLIRVMKTAVSRMPAEHPAVALVVREGVQ